MRISNLLSVLFLGGTLFLGSCDNKSCDEVFCGFNQSCRSGNCYCIDGYEGQDCQTEAWVKYVGTYNVSEQCAGGPSTGFHTTSFSQGFRLNEITINDFLLSGVSVPMTIHTDVGNNGNILEINDQGGGSVRDIAGRGEYFPNLRQIRFEVTYQRGFEFRQCEVTFFKL